MKIFIVTMKFTVTNKIMSFISWGSFFSPPLLQNILTHQLPKDGKQVLAKTNMTLSVP